MEWNLRLHSNFPDFSDRDFLEFEWFHDRLAKHIQEKNENKNVADGTKFT